MNGKEMMLEEAEEHAASLGLTLEQAAEKFRKAMSILAEPTTKTSNPITYTNRAARRAKARGKQ